MTIRLPALIALLGALAAPATAQEARFDIRLAGATLGQIAVGRAGDSATLTTVMDNTPLGVGDGRFDATFTNGAYRSLSVSSDESRRIDIDFAGDRVANVAIVPPSEATDASVPAAVPAGVLDPARGFARVALAPDCVGAFRIYDGRRVVTVSLGARRLGAESIDCIYDYRVTGGPGHLSPFRFRKVSMVARYAVTNGTQGPLQDIALGAGPFTVRLIRR